MAIGEKHTLAPTGVNNLGNFHKKQSKFLQMEQGSGQILQGDKALGSNLETYGQT
jgi:hypothetical protein